ncbi:MAG: 2-oxoacid:acceptor oxidoreductase family protein [Oscillospiraceae bacterium]|nr:2-oxoacid:acceptor oxidoreductase family protein [Oscillospiraceae bacterium]
MTNFSAIFAGFGGQGVLFMGKVTAYVGLLLGKEVSWMPSYGPEMRGGTANCSVCISDTPIGSPVVTEPDALVAMNLPSYDKFLHSVKPGGLLIYDDSMFKPAASRDDIRAFALPATALASEEGLGGIANMIMLGRTLKEAGLAGLEIIEQAIEKSVPSSKPGMIEHNLRALKLGMN